MNVTILTLFPGLFQGFLESSILARAISRGLVSVRLVDIRDYAQDKHHVCDDAAYGGGPGMVMKPEPIASAIEAARVPGARIVYLTPAGGGTRRGTPRRSRGRRRSCSCADVTRGSTRE